MPERRGYRRFAAEGNVVLKLTDGSSRKIDAELVDLSYLGACVYTLENIEEGSEIDFELRFPFWHEVMSGKGKVTSALEIMRDKSRVFRIGVDFLDVNKRLLGSVLAHLLENIRIEDQNKRKARNRPTL